MTRKREPRLPKKPPSASPATGDEGTAGEPMLPANAAIEAELSASQRTFVGRAYGGFYRPNLGVCSPELYSRFGREQAIAFFAEGRDPQTLHGGQWVRFPDAALLFAKFDGDGATGFRCASSIDWRDGGADRDYHEPPEWAKGGHGGERPTMHVFGAVRGEDGEHIYLGQLAPSHAFGSGGANFELMPAVPSAVWRRLGGDGRLDTRGVDVDAALDRLAGPTSFEQRFEVLQEVMRYWGNRPPALEDGVPESELAGIEMPEALRRFYLLAGRAAWLVEGCDDLMSPNRLADCRIARRLWFLTENQACAFWGTSPAGTDPGVWGGHTRDRSAVRCARRLTTFLIERCLNRATDAAGPYHAHGVVTSANLNAVRRYLRPLYGKGLPAELRTGRVTEGVMEEYIYHGGGAVACISRRDAGHWYINIGAKSEAALGFLHGIEAAWRHASF